MSGSGNRGGSSERADAPSASERLDSWKEIATYLQRSVRTVQRWEKEEDLPVRRHQHRKQGTVYAYPGEIDAWLRAREPEPPDPGASKTAPSHRGVQEGSGATGEGGAAAGGDGRARSRPGTGGRPGRGHREEAPGGGGQRRDPAPSIAVLPFANLSPDEADEYFCDGITEELINLLARVDGLRVPSRTSVFQFKGASGDIQEIGDRLDVATVLEGSVRRAGERLRITAQLVDAGSGYHLWSETYERQIEDVFAIQDEIAGAIVDRLKLTLEGADPGSASETVDRRRTGNPDAHEAYLRGRHFWLERTPDDLDKAAESFREAIERDPEYALAWAGLADVYNMLGYHGHRPPREVFPEAKQAADRALEIDGGLAEARASLGFATMFYDWEFEAAEEELRRALELWPDYPVAHYWYGLDLAAMGRPLEAALHVREARELEPLSPLINVYSAGALYFGRQYDQAVERCRSTLEIEPDFALAHLVLGWVYREQGRHEDAVAALERAVELSPGSLDHRAWLGHALAVAGDTDGAGTILEELDDLAEERYVSAGHRALVLAGLDRREEALDGLEAAFEERFPWLVFLRVEPAFDDLRDEERFQTLLEKMGL